MSVVQVRKASEATYSTDAFGQDLGLQELAELIRLGHEIEVVDEQGSTVTKETLVDVALHVAGVATTARARERLLQEDIFTLHQLIEDDEVADKL